MNVPRLMIHGLHAFETSQMVVARGSCLAARGVFLLMAVAYAHNSGQSWCAITHDECQYQNGP